MKKFEDAFQQLASGIIRGTISQIDDAGAKIVRDFYALWYMRATRRHPPKQEFQLPGFLSGGGLTPDQEEMSEKNGYAYMRSDGRGPARFPNDIRIRTGIIHLSNLLASVPWGIIRAHEGEFLVPDIPTHLLVPLTPTLCVLGSAPNGTILKENVAEINGIVKAGSKDYFFARDLSKCPL